MQIKKYALLIVFGTFVVLAGCGQSAEEKIYNHLEETVSLEGDFAKTQNEMTDLESKENKIYDEIMELGMDDFKQIKKLAAEADKNIEKRTDKLALEQESVEKAKEEFKKTKSLIGDLKEKEKKTKAKKMYDVMMKRYKAYDQLHQAYKQSLAQEKKLYDVLQKKDSTQEDLTKQINDLNQNYEKVIAANKDFNKFTNSYNQAKKAFYKQTDLKVSYETKNR